MRTDASVGRNVRGKQGPGRTRDGNEHLTVGYEALKMT